MIFIYCAIIHGSFIVLYTGDLFRLSFYKKVYKIFSLILDFKLRFLSEMSDNKEFDILTFSIGLVKFPKLVRNFIEI